MQFSERLRKQYYDYLLYLDDGGERMSFTEDHNYTEGLVHASSLMDCPLKAAAERSGRTPVFEHLTKRANVSLMHRMQLGVRSAEAFQESILFGARYGDWVGAVERVLQHPTLPLQGRYDGFVRTPKQSHAIEVKHRLPTYKDKFPQPRIGDVFQLLAYMDMIGHNCAGHLVILNTPAYRDFTDPMSMMEIWDLVPVSGGYSLVSEHGYSWAHPLNTPEHINRETLVGEVMYQMQYLNGETKPPIDLMDGDHAWQCRSIRKYPKNGAPGIIDAACAYWCHSAPEVIENGALYTEEGLQIAF